MRLQFAAAILFTATTIGQATAQGDAQTTFPGWAPTAAVTRIQEKADTAFEAGDYRRAMWLYSKELAPIGDKYGQYMVGFMYEHGLAVARDPVQAAAWYSLAAERGHEPIVAAAEQFQRTLGPAQRDAAGALATSLKERMGDKALVRREIRRDLERVNSMTGSRIRSRQRRDCGSRPGRVLVGMSSMSFSQYCEAINDRIDRHVAYLEGYVTYGELELVPDENDARTGDDAADTEQE